MAIRKRLAVAILALAMALICMPGVTRVARASSVWTEVSLGIGDMMSDVAYGNGCFIAISYDTGRIYKSTDNGQTWQHKYTANQNLGYITFGNGTFIATDNNREFIFYSQNNGENWNEMQVGYNGGNLNGITYGNLGFVAAGCLGSSMASMFTSIDGISGWSNPFLELHPDGGGMSFAGAGFGDGTYIVVGSKSSIYHSTDAQTWIPSDYIPNTDYYMAVAYGNGVFVAGSWAGSIIVSSDGGVTWSLAAPIGSYWINDIVYGNGCFYAVANGGNIFKSYDGYNWNADTSGTATDLWGIGYGNGYYVAAGNSGMLLVRGPSSDATLKNTSTVKGRSVISLGTPAATLGAAAAGSVAITAAQAANTSNLFPYITLFDPTDEGVSSVKTVKYAAGASTAGFETDVAYAGQAIADGDFFIVKVTAEDGTILYYRINVAVAPELISAATVTITVPAAGATPVTAALAEAATHHLDYTVTSLSWNEALTAGGKFKAGQVYTATVTLTSKNYKTFQAASFTPAVAGSASVGGTATSGTGIGNTVTFTVIYNPTAPLEVTGIEITTQPLKMVYTEAEDGTLALDGMVVTQTFNDGTTGTVTFADGTAPGYTADPENDTALTNADHNGTVVTVTHTASGAWAQTGSLTVAPAPTYGISLDPGTGYTFPAVTVGYGAQAVHTVTVNSTGTGATGALTVALSGANAGDFELSATSIASIVPLGSDSFTVAPRTGLVAGVYTATVTVSGGSVAPQSFNVSFTVNDTYGISLDPGTDYTFPAAAVGYGPQTAHTVTVNNTGTGATGALTVALSGTNAGDFELSASSISSIAPLGSGSFTVVPRTGLVAGVYTTAVTVSGGSVSPQSFNISFTVNDTYGISLDPGTDYTFPAALVGYGPQAAHAVTVNNAGSGATGALTVTLSGTGGGAFEFSKISIASIAPGGSDSFTVSPRIGLGVGTYTATVTVYGGSVSPQSFNISFTVNDTYGITLDPGTDYTFPAALAGYGAQTARTVAVNNTGTGATGALTVALSGVNAGDFDLNKTSIANITPLGSDSFTVVPRTGLAAGVYTAAVTVYGGSVSSQSFNISFTVNDTYGISLDPGTDYTFPAAAVGYGPQAAHAVTISNAGTGATGALTVALSGTNAGDFELSATSIASIAPLGSDSFTVAPRIGLLAGAYTAAVTVSGGSVSSQSFNINFTVNDTYGISLDPGTDYTFPAAVIGYGPQAAHAVTVYNAGTGATGVLAVALSGANAGDFELNKTSIASIASLGSDSFTVAPKSGLYAGVYTAAVTVSGGSVSPQSFNISFIVNDTYGITLDPGTDYIFPAALAGYSAQTARTVAVNNTGTGATGALTVALTGANAGDFELNKTSIASIAPLGSDSFTVVPRIGLGAGVYTAAVTVSGVSVSPQSFNVSFTVNDTYGISLDPGTDYIFPAATVGYAPQAAHTVTVNNAGTGATGALTVALSGTNAGDFELTATSIASIAPFGSGTFAVAPRTGLGAGVYTATVTVSGGSVSSQSFNISFTVNDTYGISLDPGTDYTFPAAVVGYGPQAAHAVIVYNTGTGATGVLTAALSGANAGDFELNKTSIASIASLGSDSFTVAPKSGLYAGVYTAAVTVSGGSVPPQSFNVSFTVDPAPTYGISLDPAENQTFPAAAVGYGPQTPHTVTVSSTGTGSTGALTVALSGTNAGDFELSKTSIASLAPLGSDSFAVVPKIGLGAGVYTAVVTVSGGSVSPQSFDISFTVNDTYDITLEPYEDYTFAAATEGYDSQAAYTVIVRNTGTGATGSLTVSLTGLNANDLELSKTSIASLISGGSDSFTVVPKTGLSKGTYTATVTVSGANVAAQSFNVSFTVNYAMDQGVLQEEVTSTTIIAEGLFADDARLVVVPIEAGETDRQELEEQMEGKDVLAAFEVSIEPADAFQPPLTLTFQVDAKYNGRTVYILHRLSNGDMEIYTPTVQDGAAVITVNQLSPFLLAADPAVVITAQPQSVTALVGETASFHVTAEGTEPITYRWQRRTGVNAAWEDISGAARADYTTTRLNKSHNGYQYRVIVGDGLGNSVTSDIAVLTVTASPDTGDDSQPLVYVTLTVLFAGLALMLLRKRKSV